MVNELDLFPVVWAAQRAGLYYAPVNWHLSADEAAYIVADCGARLLISSASLEPLAAAAAAAATGLDGRLVAGDGAAGVVAGGTGAAGVGAESLDAAVEGLPGTPVDDETEGWYMFYSSGTTGKPKGIVRPLTGQPFGAGLGTETVMRLVFGFSPSSVYLCPGPLYHAAPLAWSIGAIRNGGTVVVMERFDAATALSLIERYRVTEGQFVPTMFVRMLRLPAAERRSTTCPACASPCTPRRRSRSRSSGR